MNKNLIWIISILFISSFVTFSFAQDRRFQMLNQHFYPIGEKDSANLAYYSLLNEISEDESLEEFFDMEMRLVKSIRTGINEEGGFLHKVTKTFDEYGKLSSEKTINLENNKFYAVYYENEVFIGEVIFDGLSTYENKIAANDQAIFLDRNEFEPAPFTDKQLWQKNLIKNLRYPTQARSLRETGTVMLMLLVDQDSNLVRIEVANPMDIAKSLAEEAVRVAKLYKGKFIAATDMEGNPIEAWLPIPIRFKLGI